MDDEIRMVAILKDNLNRFRLMMSDKEITEEEAEIRRLETSIERRKKIDSIY